MYWNEVGWHFSSLKFSGRKSFIRPCRGPITHCYEKTRALEGSDSGDVISSHVTTKQARRSSSTPRAWRGKERSSANHRKYRFLLFLSFTIPDICDSIAAGLRPQCSRQQSRSAWNKIAA